MKCLLDKDIVVQVGQLREKSEIRAAVGKSVELHTLCTFRVEIHVECAPVCVVRIVPVILEIGLQMVQC